MAKQETKKPFVMNLQLFADTNTEGQQPTQPTQPSQADLTAQAMAILQNGGQQPTEGTAPMDNMNNMPMGQPTPTEGNPQNSPQIDNNSGQPTGQQPSQEPTQGQPQQQAPNSADQMLLGKFKSPEDLANGYVNVEKAFSQKSNEVAALQQQLQAAQQQMQNMQQQIQSVVNPQQQQPQPSQEELNEQFMNQFYENPTQSIQQMVQQAIEKSIMPQIAPIQQQFQQQQQAQAFDQALNQFKQQTPDFNQFSPQMREILTSNPEFNHMEPNKALQMAYGMAKGQQYQDPNALLQNQDFVKQNIMGNQDIKNQIIQEYLQSLKQNNTAPTVINGQANGATPVVPQSQPKTIKEARDIAMQYFNK